VKIVYIRAAYHCQVRILRRVEESLAGDGFGHVAERFRARLLWVFVILRSGSFEGELSGGGGTA